MGFRVLTFGYGVWGDPPGGSGGFGSSSGFGVSLVQF